MTEHNRTLLDMTPEEREQCVGMWVNATCGLGILKSSTISDERFKGFAYVEYTDDCDEAAEEPYRVLAPRFDLPRAWNPDGTPPSPSRR
ncbi:hypothetical protein [Corynebacterium heidelbergense]|uniref:Uncharacterized protein n=1 Tax=Corynebacterium heidelbergense TaxID=2055947 RepID=A0A364VE18_9CORY|nr:hypothetical protein [Corynebacterium heidelbergense]RAV34895.1 hypothetical protein CWC39_00720 [Corynebacterium heidelbergense]WCZ36031.1 hypothetical protein CHEID_02320 [Corynebacterium heidelbergense]